MDTRRVTPIDGAARPRLARGVRLREDKARGGTVLLAPERVLNVSPTAVELLRRCNGERDVDAIINELAAMYTAEQERIATDVRALLGDLAAKGMVEL
jgi:pyrroloquinoline quinone biosynthesis protein D